MLAVTPKRLPLKEAHKTLCSKWKRGYYNDFDSMLMNILDCPREKAEEIRERWEDLEILAYASQGFLIWCDEFWKRLFV